MTPTWVVAKVTQSCPRRSTSAAFVRTPRSSGTRSTMRSTASSVRMISPTLVTIQASPSAPVASASMASVLVLRGAEIWVTVLPTTRNSALLVDTQRPPVVVPRTAVTPRMGRCCADGCQPDALGENGLNPSGVPAHTRPSLMASIVFTSPRLVQGVTRWGTSRSTPSVVPAQMLPSRSSNTTRTASLDRPESTVVRSTVRWVLSPDVRLTRHKPWPIVPTQRLPSRSCMRRYPRPACVLRGGWPPPSARNPTSESVTQSCPVRSWLKLSGRWGSKVGSICAKRPSAARSRR